VDRIFFKLARELRRVLARLLQLILVSLFQDLDDVSYSDTPTVARRTLQKGFAAAFIEGGKLSLSVGIVPA